MCFGVGICVGICVAGNDYVSASNSVDDDGNINLDIGLRALSWVVEWDADFGGVVMP